MSDDFRVLLELLRRGDIHPVVAERLPLSDARRADELSSARREPREPDPTDGAPAAAGSAARAKLLELGR